MELDLSKPAQRVLQVKLSETKSISFILKRIKVKDAKAHAEKVKALMGRLEKGDIDGLTYSLEMLKLTCEPFDEKAAGNLDDDQLTAIWKGVRALKEGNAEETPEKKS